MWLGLWLVTLAGAQPTVPLRTVSAVRSLPPAQAAQNLPVALHGVITYFDAALFSYFIQDETCGIYLYFPNSQTQPNLAPGQVVDLTGHASPGEYAPVVQVDQVTVVGLTNLPVAKPVVYEDLATGLEDSQWVEVTGLVRSCVKSPASGFYEIEISTGGGRLQLFSLTIPVGMPAELVDGTVRVRGVCTT